MVEFAIFQLGLAAWRVEPRQRRAQAALRARQVQVRLAQLQAEVVPQRLRHRWRDQKFLRRSRRWARARLALDPFLKWTRV